MKFNLQPINTYLATFTDLPGTTHARYDTVSANGETVSNEERVIVYNVGEETTSEVELLRFNVFGTQIREDHGFDQDTIDGLAFTIHEIRK